MTSTHIIVLASNKEAIGAIESLTIKEGPGGPKLEVSRMRLLRSKLSDTFEGGHFHVASQKYPVDIVVLEDKVVTIQATHVWLTGTAISYMTDEWIITEGIELECEYVTGTKTYKTSSESDDSTST